MNRRGFFGAVAAAVTAACVPELPGTMEYRGSVTGRWSAKGPGFIADRYSSQYAWWRPRANKSLMFGDYHYSHDMDFAKLEARTLAALQTAWKDCLAYKSGDALMVDEQTYKIFNTLQE